MEELLHKLMYSLFGTLTIIYFIGLCFSNIVIIFYMWVVKKPRRFDLYPFMFLISIFYPILLFPFFKAMYNIIKKVKKLKNAET